MTPSVTFRGECRRRCTLDACTLTEAAYRAEHTLPLHAHEHPFFALLLSGSYTETLERGERRCAPSSLAYYPAGIPHADTFAGEGSRAFLIELRGDGLPESGGSVDDAAFLGEIRRSRLNELALRLYSAFLARPEPDGLEADELVFEMTAELRGIECTPERAPPGWLERVRERIHADFAHTLRVADLAADAGVHPVHLTRVFRRYHGCGVGAYVERLRMQHACAALVGSTEPLSHLAAELGYADQAHFTRRFRNMLKTTPGRFRDLARR